MADNALRIFPTDHPNLPRTVAGKIRKEIEDRSGQIARGLAPDYAMYRERVGFIAGLGFALEICQDVEKDMDE